eukprot:COSAG04_NODE_254_length_18809_cov_8.025869_18_plen_88_part_00
MSLLFITSWKRVWLGVELAWWCRGTLSCVAWLSHNLFWFLEFSFRTVPLSLHSFSLLTETLFGAPATPAPPVDSQVPITHGTDESMC